MAEIVAEGAGIRGGRATKKKGMAEIVAEEVEIRLLEKGESNKNSWRGGNCCSRALKKGRKSNKNA